MEKLVTILGWFVLVTLMLAIARQLSEESPVNSFPVFNKRLLEQFESGGAIPASYALLSDVLPSAKGPAGLSAKTCYEKDFLARTAKTGNYNQCTNNFIHAKPDNCSSPLTEFVDSIYSP